MNSSSRTTSTTTEVATTTTTATNQGVLSVQGPGSVQVQAEQAVMSVFSQTDISLWYRVYREGRLCLANPYQRHLTRYTSVEDFIFETRKTAGMLADFRDIDDIVNDQSEAAVLMRTWLTQVVPSCVYRHRSEQFGQTGFYICCFAECCTPCSSQYGLIRHYREQHFTRIPPGIFGVLKIYKCQACSVQFKRKEHLDHHCTTLNHITMMAMLGNFVF